MNIIEQVLLKAKRITYDDIYVPEDRENFVKEVDSALQNLNDGKGANTFELIRFWAHDRNLINGATSAAQYQKLCEEVGELGRGLIEDAHLETKDAIGDCVVVLTILAAQLGMTLEECVVSAYAEIKDRKGKMVNGIFVKEAA